MKPFKMLYASSYDRGLEHLLKMWPEIKKKIPGATLDVCYGWEMFLKGYANNPYMMSWKERMEKLMEQEGITHHGRLPKKELDEITKSCDIWAYYCTFDETNCITALNCQRLGCVPITMAKAGLLTTVYSGIMIDGDGLEPETKEAYLKAVIMAYENPEWLEKERKIAMSGINKFNWSNIAKEWEKQWLN